MIKCKIDIEEDSKCAQCCNTCRNTCEKKCVFAKFNSECNNQMRSIVDVGYSESVLTGNTEELRKLGINIKFEREERKK